MPAGMRHDCGNDAHAAGTGRHSRPHQPARPHGVGRIPDSHARSCSWRLHDAGRHAAELPAGNHHRGRARRNARPPRANASSTGPHGAEQWRTIRQHILPLARAGVLGFKCFLIYPGCDGFTMIDQQQLERRFPSSPSRAFRFSCTQNSAGPIDAAMEPLRDADWRRYATYLASRPDQAELEAIRLMIRLCRQYRFRLHIVHLSTALRLKNCTPHAPKACRSRSKLARTICTSRRRRSPMERHY